METYKTTVRVVGWCVQTYKATEESAARKQEKQRLRGRIYSIESQEYD